MAYMHSFRQAVACERVRAQASIELDGELSQLEQAMLAAHISHCPDCRAYRAEVHAFTRSLRSAPLVRPSGSIAPRRHRRVAAAVIRFQPAVAVAMAFAVVGIATQLAVPRQLAPSSAPAFIVSYPSAADLAYEAELVLAVTRTESRGARPEVR
jgi:predicted anti-sigma-YlaC factor YlaD